MKKLFSALSSLLLSVVSLAVFAPGVVHAIAPYTCTWTGATNNNFNTAGNWTGCNSAAPQPGDGDSLVFNQPSSATTLTNDITGLTLNSITFQGSNSGNFTIAGNGISLAGGISVTSHTGNSLQLPLTLTAPQTFAGLGIDSTSSLNVGSNALTISNGPFIFDSISGSGAITVNGAVQPQAFVPGLYLNGSSPNYSGTITIASGQNLSITADTGNLGTASIVVQNGGSLTLNGAADTATFSNNISVAGTGINGYGAIISCLDSGQGCSEDGHNTTLNLTGALTLTGDTQIANGAFAGSQNPAPASSATFNLTGALTANGHTIAAIPNSNTILAGNLVVTANKTTTPATTAKTPNTGFGASKNRPFIALGGAVLVSGALLVASRSKLVRGRR
ncbi:MAG TPA: hypothetical protein VLG16_01035 [Candidatus Saccharimonadales bacterium]|nr:hypothetical protein [Candidatus Saccharimonadales bacterium]